MYKLWVLASLAVLGAANDQQQQQYKHFDCGTDSKAATKDFKSTLQFLHSNQTLGAPGARIRAAAALQSRNNASIEIPLHIHIVTSTAKKNKVSTTMAKSQSNVLNNVYNPYGIYFKLRQASLVVNDVWAAGATDEDDLAMKQALRAGTYSTLNLYMQTDLAGQILGKCSLPTDIGPPPIDQLEYANDGCNIQAQTMPGGSIRSYNMGMTAVHETGHWLGLLHTFEGYDCGGDGDFIDDTPAQSTSTDGCPTAPPKDSCPGHDGLDAIHNVMDYSTDICYTGFTPMQKERMWQMWDMYRAGR